jgi:hypothetical protein
MKNTCINLIVTGIQWDSEGHSKKECELPDTIVILNSPNFIFLDEEIIGKTISESFGFNINGFQWEEFVYTGKFYPPNLALIEFKQ